MPRCRNVSTLICPSMLHPIQYCHLRSQCSTTCIILKQEGGVAGNGEKPEIVSENVAHELILCKRLALQNGTSPQYVTIAVHVDSQSYLIRTIDDVLYLADNILLHINITSFYKTAHLVSVRRRCCRSDILLLCSVFSTWC